MISVARIGVAAVAEVAKTFDPLHGQKQYERKSYANLTTTQNNTKANALTAGDLD